MNNNYAIETTNLNYIFSRGKKVVNDVGLQVPQGSIFGFLGPNGAGKTTTIRMLTGMLENDPDNIFIQGKSLKNHNPSIFESMGTLIEMPSLYLHLSGRDNLRVITRLRSIDETRIDEVLKIVNLEHDAGRKAKEYSLGMKQRLGIALALLSKPTLLILDEPANGLDPAGIIEIRELLIQLNRDHGITIFISSHLLNEVERTCTHVGIIHKGKLMFQGSMAELQQNAGHGKQVTISVFEAEKWKGHIISKFPEVTVTKNNDFVFMLQEADEVNSINRQLVQDTVPVRGIRLNEGLEEWFIKMTSN